MNLCHFTFFNLAACFCFLLGTNVKAKHMVFNPEKKVHGFISIKEGQYYLFSKSENSEFLLTPLDSLVMERLLCLKDGDSISGVGQQINSNEILLGSIEYVGLKKILAYWYNKHEIFNFSDFGNFNHWLYSNGNKVIRGPFRYRYALSPTSKKNDLCTWKIFIADERKVILGNIKWISDHILQLEIYDSNSGEIFSTKNLIQTMI